MLTPEWVENFEIGREAITASLDTYYILIGKPLSQRLDRLQKLRQDIDLYYHLPPEQLLDRINGLSRLLRVPRAHDWFQEAATKYFPNQKRSQDDNVQYVGILLERIGNPVEDTRKLPEMFREIHDLAEETNAVAEGF